MGKVYYWIQENRTKWYGGLCVIGLLILLFVKNSFWFGASLGMLTASAFYFIWLGFQKIRNKRIDKDDEMFERGGSNI